MFVVVGVLFVLTGPAYRKSNNTTLNKADGILLKLSTWTQLIILFAAHLFVTFTRYTKNIIVLFTYVKESIFSFPAAAASTTEIVESRTLVDPWK